MSATRRMGTTVPLLAALAFTGCGTTAQYKVVPFRNAARVGGQPAPRSQRSFSLHSLSRTRLCLQAEGFTADIAGFRYTTFLGVVVPSRFHGLGFKRRFVALRPPVLEVSPVVSRFSDQGGGGVIGGPVHLEFFPTIARARLEHEELARLYADPHFLSTGGRVRRLSNVVYVHPQGTSPAFAKIEKCIRSS